MNLEDALKEAREKVGVIPWWIMKFPLFRTISGLPLKDKFLLTPHLYKDFMSKNPSPYVAGLVIHELEHLRRAKDKGFWKYHILYRLSNQFRYNEELECTKPQMKYFKEVEYNFNLESRAKVLSGPLYFWQVSYGKALSDLKNLWMNIS